MIERALVERKYKVVDRDEERRGRKKGKKHRGKELKRQSQFAKHIAIVC